MKIWINWKKIYLINQKAQALTELAVFGTVLLFCLALLIQFGLQINYQQNIQMQAFRKAQKLAYYKQGPGSPTSLVLIKDKPVVDPRDRWGFADRTPIGSGANITFSNTLDSVYTNNFDPPPNPRDLPRVYFEVDKSMRLDEAEINDDIDKNQIATEQKGAFTTADFGTMPCKGREFGIYIEDSAHNYQKDTDYYMVRVKAEDIKVYEDAEDPSLKRAFYKDYSGLKRELTSVDLTPNDKSRRTVDIIAVGSGLPTNCDSNGYCGTLANIWYLDSEVGRIDSYYTDVRPGDKDKTLATKQGLLPNYSKVFEYRLGAALTTKENKNEFSTNTASDARQLLTHKIRLNNKTRNDDGSLKETNQETREVPVEFKPAQSYNWTVKYE